jgi:hypothetical protein
MSNLATGYDPPAVLSTQGNGEDISHFVAAKHFPLLRPTHDFTIHGFSEEEVEMEARLAATSSIVKCGMP